MTTKPERQARFWKKFMRMTRVGVPLLRALEVIGSEETDAAFRKTIQSLRKEIENGATFSGALKKFPSEFSASSIEMIRTAEQRGVWDDILIELCEGLSDGTFA